MTLSAGGSEIVCSVRSRSAQQRDDLLLQRLPATSQVLSMAAHAILHRYVGGASTDWTGYGELLTAAQVEALQPEGAAKQPDPPVRLEPEDAPLVDELALDGRCSYAALAAATGWSQGRVTRLESAGTEMAGHAEVPFASAITGSANLVASVVCRDTEALYRYVTTKVSATSGARQLEISPVLRRVKQGGTWMEGPRLAAPALPMRARSTARPARPRT